MYIVGYSAAVLAVIVVGGAAVIGVSSIPDIRRYLRLRGM
ncbi:MAG: DUF6893 family small protein [Pseudonocardiaceae bacterium]